MAENAALTQQRNISFFDRHAWKIMLGVMLFIALFGISDMIGGAAELQNGETILMHSLTDKSWDDLRTESPQATQLVEWIIRANDASLFIRALLGLAICLTGFRKGERWAWLALWGPAIWMLLTVFFTLNAVRYPEYGTPVPAISGSILLVLWTICLAATYRKFSKRGG